MRTTLQPKAQDAAQKAIDYVTPNNTSKVGAAATTIQPGTGKIISMVQASHWPTAAAVAKAEGPEEARLGLHDVNWNVDKAYGSSDGFQTGSTFKAFTLAAALKSGHDPQRHGQRAAERRHHRPASGTARALRSAASRGTGYYSPQNDERGAVGSVSLYKATAALDQHGVRRSSSSRSGVCKVASMAAQPRRAPGRRRASTARPSSRSCRSLTLGTQPDRADDDGRGLRDVRGQRQVLPADRDHLDHQRERQEVHRRRAPNCTQVLDKDVAHGVTSALQKVILDRWHRRRHRACPVASPAGKTGTTNDNHQAWFVGYTPQLSTAVYVGHPTIAEQVLISGESVGNGHRLPGHGVRRQHRRHRSGRR